MYAGIYLLSLTLDLFRSPTSSLLSLHTISYLSFYSIPIVTFWSPFSEFKLPTLSLKIFISGQFMVLSEQIGHSIFLSLSFGSSSPGCLFCSFQFMFSDDFLHLWLWSVLSFRPILVALRISYRPCWAAHGPQELKGCFVTCPVFQGKLQSSALWVLCYSSCHGWISYPSVC